MRELLAIVKWLFGWEAKTSALPPIELALTYT